jgi:4-oxalocrotonate tautomerase
VPMISVQLGVQRSPGLSAKVARLVTDVTAKVLHKDPHVTAVAIQYIDPADWYIAGESLDNRKSASFFVDARITDGTNTKDEKAAYVREIFETMSGLLGGVHPESYVHADDVRGDAYGYGGLTQEERRYAGATAAVPA